MLKTMRYAVLVCIAAGLARTTAAATFVVPEDRQMIRRSDAIVIATPLASYTRLTENGSVETVTNMSIEKVMKGPLTATVIDVVEPGGVFRDKAVIIPGVPQFEEGKRLLLFLKQPVPGRWVVSELVLGKFNFGTDRSGRRIVAREEDEINGWDSGLKPHVEKRRSADRFLEFISQEIAGAPASEDYYVERQPFRLEANGTSSNFTPQSDIAPYSITSYTMALGATTGGRWAQFPNAVPFYRGQTQLAGAPNGGDTAITTAFSAWNNDCGSNVNLAYSGASAASGGLRTPDGVNSVLWERDLSYWGISPFVCSGNSYSGTLGLGGVTATAGTHTLSGETFFTISEGDVEMNRGLSNCSLLLNSGDINSAVAHEVGHALGFRHSDQNRASSGACDPGTMECSTTAIMKSFVSQGLNATLQVWDQHAVQAVYPGAICAPGTTTPPPPPPACTPPQISGQPSSSAITSGGSAQISVIPTGTSPFTYQWYVGTSGNTATPVSGGTTQTITVRPTTTTSYWVRVSNSCGSVNSTTATVTVSPAPAARRVRTDFGGDGLTDLIWRHTDGTIAMWEMNVRTILNGAAIGSLPPNWQIQGYGDFFADGRWEIVLRNTSDGQIAFWEMNGHTLVNGAAVGTAPLAWRIELIGDFNGDRMSDILLRNTNSGDVAMWEMNGRTVVNGAAFITLPLVWRFETAGDFNRDGREDIIVRNSTTGQVALWEMNGRTLLNGAAITTVGLDWQIQPATNDFNGDGYADLIWRNTSTGSIAMWEMNVRTILNGGAFATLPPEWQIRSSGHFNSDVYADLFLFNTSTGLTALWEMNGRTLLNGAAITNVPAGWQPQNPK